jgi:hypothetical protein
MDNATAALSRMNMVLHDCPTAEIWRDNTLANPHFRHATDKTALQTFDYVVAKPHRQGHYLQRRWHRQHSPQHHTQKFADNVYGPLRRLQQQDYGCQPQSAVRPSQ